MLSANTILQKRYRIIRQIGHGGMGAVYEAIDERVSSVVALKETFADNQAMREAFEREAKLLANLEHEAFPRVMDYFSEGDGQYLVMELVRGNDLGELLGLRESAFGINKVLEWADQLLDALEDLHSYRPPILHRDIKPSNLKLTSKKGKIILLDFGIAKGAAGQMSLVETTGSVGSYTPHYASLEQSLRADRRWIDVLSIVNSPAVEEILRKGTDPRTDLYALGATLYHLMTGQLPIDAPTRAMAVWSGKPDQLRPAHEVNAAVPAAVGAVVGRAMALDRNQRPSSAREMRAALREAAQDRVDEPKIAPATRLPPEIEERSRQRAEEDARLRREAETLWEEEGTQQRIAEAEAQQRAEEEARKQRAAEAAARRAEEERRRHEEEERAPRLEEAAQRVRAEKEAALRLAAEQEERRRAQEKRAREEEEERKRVQQEAARRAEALRQQEAERQKHEADRQRQQDEARRIEEENLRRQTEEERRRSNIPATHLAAGQRGTHEEVRGGRVAEKEGAVGNRSGFQRSTADTINAGAGFAPIHPGGIEPVRGVSKAKIAAVVLVGAFFVIGVAVIVLILLLRSIGPAGSSQNGTTQTPGIAAGEAPSQSGVNTGVTETPTKTKKPTAPAGMAYVPGGDFIMGRSGDATGYESPPHKVSVKPFFMDIYEVTNEDYQKFITAQGHVAPASWTLRTYPTGAARKPVTGVTWEDAKAYADFITKRLPTEEEWEFAARGGDDRRYPWGNEWNADLANAGSGQVWVTGGGNKGMAEVGSFKGASPYGLYDMVGNAWEWTASYLKAYPGGKLPAGASSTDMVIRGGSWASKPNEATTTFRRGWSAHGEKDYSFTGFRLVKDVSDSSN
jgi:formylglycine-generating enzyme required for sulfatase activity